MYTCVYKCVHGQMHGRIFEASSRRTRKCCTIACCGVHIQNHSSEYERMGVLSCSSLTESYAGKVFKSALGTQATLTRESKTVIVIGVPW